MVGRLFGYVMVGVALVILLAVFYLSSTKSTIPLVFSPTQVLDATWRTYLNHYVEEGSYRTVDTARANITTSEGQSYTMLRAVWIGDKTVFDGAWQWTKENLQHSDDALFAWKWGQRADGTMGILHAEQGNTSASDADTNIALALVFAFSRWQDPDYLDAARAVIDDIWEKEVIVIRGTPYLAANDLEKQSSSPSVIVNPSYLNPAAYRIFARVDPTHPWDALVTSSQTLLAMSATAPLDTGGGSGLPPNWLRVNKQTGALEAAQASGIDSHFGFDAMRVPFALALDAAWFNDPRDTEALAQFTFLSRAWQESGALGSIYGHDGSVVDPVETPAMYGATIGYFMHMAPREAEEIYTTKLLALYNPGTNTWRVPLSYYDDNWAWFGIALYNNALPDLSARLPRTAFTE